MNTDGAVVETEPLGDSTVSFDLTASSNTQAKVVWTAITGASRGASTAHVAITQYELWWNQGSVTNTWVLL